MNLQIVRGDITVRKVDAIVNAANTTLLGGGGVDGAIHRAAGPELLEECRTLHGWKLENQNYRGYRLPARYIIHTPGPIWRGRNGVMRQNDWKLLPFLLGQREQWLPDHRFPSISTGVYHFPLEQAAEIAVRTILQYGKGKTRIVSVEMVCFDDRTKAAYDAALKLAEKNAALIPNE